MRVVIAPTVERTEADANKLTQQHLLNQQSHFPEASEDKTTQPAPLLELLTTSTVCRIRVRLCTQHLRVISTDEADALLSSYCAVANATEYRRLLL